MPTASTLDQAVTFAMRNIFAQLGNTDLVARTNVWLAAFDELSTTIEEQRLARNWIIPTIFARDKIPTALAAQDVTNIQDLFQTVTRSIDHIRGLTLTAPQIASILVIYNSAWT